MNYKIIIPTFKRYDIIKSHTLNAIYKTDLQKNIYVFVASEEEKKLYESALYGYEIKIILGVRGIPNQRNYIQNYFNENDCLLFIDDDIKKITGLDGNNKRIEAKKMHDFVCDAFSTINKLGLKMFGINSTDSNLEMKNSASIGLIYIVGNFYGIINTHDLFVDEGTIIPKRKTFEAGKESHERVLKMYYKYGGVIKYRAFGVTSKYWGVKGGHQISRNESGEKQATEILHCIYKDVTEIRVKNGFTDLVIKHKTKVFETKYYQ